MRPRIILAILLFASANSVIAGNRWWDLHPQAEREKLFDEYEQYLLPTKDGLRNPDNAKAAKAGEMVRFAPGQQDRAIKISIAWSKLYENEKDKKKKQVLELSRLGYLRMIDNINDSSKNKFVQKLPDRFIDDYFWALKVTNGHEDWLRMIGNFGPRASRLADPLRAWYSSKSVVGKESMRNLQETLKKITK